MLCASLSLDTLCQLRAMMATGFLRNLSVHSSLRTKSSSAQALYNMSTERHILTLLLGVVVSPQNTVSEEMLADGHTTLMIVRLVAIANTLK